MIEQDWDGARHLFMVLSQMTELALLIVLVAAMGKMWTIIRSLIDMGMALQRYEDLSRQGKVEQAATGWQDWSRQAGGRSEGSRQQ